MARKTEPKPETDKAVWRSVTSDVKPLRGRGKPAAVPAHKDSGASTTRPTAPKSLPSNRPTATAPLPLGRAPGVDRRTAERLRRGQMPLEARLDLHGHSRESAHTALNGFLAAAWETGRRAVLIVTGKGQGILKDAVPRWLNEQPNRGRILLVAQAQPKDGGGGALYVLLRRRR